MAKSKKQVRNQVKPMPLNKPKPTAKVAPKPVKAPRVEAVQDMEMPGIEKVIDDNDTIILAGMFTLAMLVTAIVWNMTGG